MEGGAVDEFIERLLEGKKSKAGGKKIQLSEAEIRHVCVAAKEIFLVQPNLLELEAPINVCGKFNYQKFLFMYCFELDVA